jgi:hypothetical protein
MNLKHTLTRALTVTRALAVLFSASVAPASVLQAQQAPEAISESPIPVITGDFRFQSTFESGTRTLSPEFDPTLLVPLGRNMLIESEFDMSTCSRTAMNSGTRDCGSRH